MFCVWRGVGSVPKLKEEIPGALSHWSTLVSPMRERWSRGLGWCWLAGQVRERQTGAVTLPEPRVIQEVNAAGKEDEEDKRQTKRRWRVIEVTAGNYWVMSNRETRLMWSLIPDGNRIGRWEWLWGERINVITFAQFVRLSGWHITTLYL